LEEMYISLKRLINSLVSSGKYETFKLTSLGNSTPKIPPLLTILASCEDFLPFEIKSKLTLSAETLKILSSIFFSLIFCK